MAGNVSRSRREARNMRAKHMLVGLLVFSCLIFAAAVCSRCSLHGVTVMDNHNMIGCKRFPLSHQCELCMPAASSSGQEATGQAATGQKRKKKKPGPRRTASAPAKNKNAKKGPDLGDKSYGIRSFHVTVTNSGRDTPKTFFDIGCDIVREFTVPGLHASCCEEIGKEERHRHIHFALPIKTAQARKGLEMVRREVKRRFPNEEKFNHVHVKEMKVCALPHILDLFPVSCFLILYSLLVPLMLCVRVCQGLHRISSLVGYHMKTYGQTSLRMLTYNFTQSEILDAYNRFAPN